MYFCSESTRIERGTFELRCQEVLQLPEMLEYITDPTGITYIQAVVFILSHKSNLKTNIILVRY